MAREQQISKGHQRAFDGRRRRNEVWPHRNQEIKWPKRTRPKTVFSEAVNAYLGIDYEGNPAYFTREPRIVYRYDHLTGMWYSYWI